MKKDREFLNLVTNGNNQVIDYLKKDKQLKNIKDEKGNNIVHYLIAGNQIELTKSLLNKKLISYMTYLRTMNELVGSQSYKKDNYYGFIMLLKSHDKEKIIIKNIENIIKNNNIKTYAEIEKEEIIKNQNIGSINFIIFVDCNEEMLENSMQLYRKIQFNTTNMKEGFAKIKANKIRTSILMENLSVKISPLIYEELNRVNEYCRIYMENKELYKRLEKKMVKKESNILKKI